MKNRPRLLKAALLITIWSAASWAVPTTGYFSSQGVRLQPRDFIIVHEEEEGRIRLHFTDLPLSEDQKKYLAGNRGNDFSENTAQFYIPVEISADGVVRDKNEVVDVYSFGKTEGYWRLPAQDFTLNGSLRKLRIQARGQKRYREKDASYDFLVEGKVYSAAERARKTYPRIAVGNKEVEVDASWDRDAVTPIVSITIQEGRNGSGQGYREAKDIRQLINALKNGDPHSHNFLKLVPRPQGFLLQTRGPRGAGPREVSLSQSQARQLASQIEQAGRHLGILK